MAADLVLLRFRTLQSENRNLVDDNTELIRVIKQIEWRLIQMREYVACERCQHSTPTDREHLLNARTETATALAAHI